MPPHFHKPKTENVHTALWNIASVTGIVGTFIRNTSIVISATIVVTVYHVVVMVWYDDEHLF